MIQGASMCNTGWSSRQKNECRALSSSYCHIFHIGFFLCVSVRLYLQYTESHCVCLCLYLCVCFLSVPIRVAVSTVHLEGRGVNQETGVHFGAPLPFKPTSDGAHACVYVEL